MKGKFLRGNIYRHCNPHSSLDMEVISILAQNQDRVKLKVRFLHRNNGRVQYTGKGKDLHTDTVRVLNKDFENWTLIGSIFRQPNIDPNLVPKEEIDDRNWEILLGDELEEPLFIPSGKTKS